VFLRFYSCECSIPYNNNIIVDDPERTAAKLVADKLAVSIRSENQKTKRDLEDRGGVVAMTANKCVRAAESVRPNTARQTCYHNNNYYYFIIAPRFIFVLNDLVNRTQYNTLCNNSMCFSDNVLILYWYYIVLYYTYSIPILLCCHV